MIRNDIKEATARAITAATDDILATAYHDPRDIPTEDAKKIARRLAIEALGMACGRQVLPLTANDPHLIRMIAEAMALCGNGSGIQTNRVWGQPIPIQLIGGDSTDIRDMRYVQASAQLREVGILIFEEHVDLADVLTELGERTDDII